MNIEEKYNLALDYYNNKNYQQAIQLCTEILSLNAHHSHTYFLLGHIFFSLNDLNMSKDFILKSIELKNDFFDAYYLLGNIYFSLEEHNNAINTWKNSLNYKNDFALVYSNIAASYLALDLFEEVTNYAQKAIYIDNTCIDAYRCLYKSYQKQKNLTKTKEFIKKLLKIEPHDTLANFDLSYILFMERDYKNGFKHFEYRKKTAENKDKYNFLPFKEYCNDDLKGKSLVIYHEQGFGDNIQFARFLNEIKCDNVSLGIQNSLHKLFQYSFQNIKMLSVINASDRFDFSAALMSIPYLFRQNLICTKKYLKVRDSDIQEFIDKNLNKNKLNIGIVWKGSDKNKSSLILKDIQSLFDKENKQFYSLQIEKDNDTNKYDIIDLGKKFENFYDTAVAICSLDLIISVDTAVAHLAGALGCKGYILQNRDMFDFRWTQENQQSNWYPSLKVFQYNNENIKQTIEKINKEIDEL